ncbi:MAG: hypothetical protein Q8M99_05670 [Methylotenera sp.]|nr:hypothetical protein [Methylotenera sp.]
MPKQPLILGPVLSFRGISEEGHWKVTALIGIPKSFEQPVLSVEGRNCANPVILLEHDNQQYLRYDVSCKLDTQERKVDLTINVCEGQVWSFTIPGIDFAPRMAYVSCNGFSDPSGMRKLVRESNSVWADLLSNHDRHLRKNNYELDKEQLWHETRTQDKNLQRFHLLVMGGDQIYFDSIWEDIKELKDWVQLSRDNQLIFNVDKKLEKKIERYYFNLYSSRWLPPSRKDWGSNELNQDAADAMARIPTVMMWDDHDIFDGWGSYSVDMQESNLFQTLFHYARKAFWVFQMQHVLEDLPTLDKITQFNISKKDPQFQLIDWAAHQQKDLLALPILMDQPGFTFAFEIGPISLVAADLRTERSRTQILGPSSWRSLQSWLSNLKPGKPVYPGKKCQHLIFLSSVPVAHPKLTLAEGLFDVFGQDNVLDSNADDLKDHWSHDDHEGERKRLLETLINIAESKKLRVSIASGDVHVAAWGTAYRKDLPPQTNWAQIQQFTSSAVVHPSLVGVFEKLFLHLLNSTASKPQTIDIQLVVEMMIFPGFNKYVMPARNWLAFELDTGSSDPLGNKLWATWRCENEKSFSNHLLAVEPAKFHLTIDSTGVNL